MLSELLLWPAPVETKTQHGLLDCWAATRGDLARWRDEVIRELGGMHRCLERQGEKVTAARQVVDRARHCMMRADTSDERGGPRGKTGGWGGAPPVGGRTGAWG